MKSLGFRLVAPPPLADNHRRNPAENWAVRWFVMNPAGNFIGRAQGRSPSRERWESLENKIGWERERESERENTVREERCQNERKLVHNLYIGAPSSSVRGCTVYLCTLAFVLPEPNRTAPVCLPLDLIRTVWSIRRSVSNQTYILKPTRICMPLIQCHYEVPAFLFSCSVRFHFSLIIIWKKQQKHANNKNHKNIFINKPWFTNQVIPFYLLLS